MPDHDWPAPGPPPTDSGRLIPPPPPEFRPPDPVSPQQPAIRQANGLAVAALVLGIVGAVLALVPFLFFLGIICGLLAVIFGGIGISKANRGAEGKGQAVAGLVLGIVAMLISTAWIFVVTQAVETVNRGGF